jgi:hypothetical protein
MEKASADNVNPRQKHNTRILKNARKKEREQDEPSHHARYFDGGTEEPTKVESCNRLGERGRGGVDR